ncbi:LexA family transcriptional regulator [Peptococcaceae bacterium SCADC1_2_3]|nr:LexA family transcriptional regulator [Peptococcaceae bacterium SCADC1_2_3]KFI35543.1 LexA family transcriptional regulator [Peptococcaceae bacterium SCADC1_2_3]
MSPLTEREQQILDFIIRVVDEKGYPPSIREIGQAVGLNSTATVHSYLKRLENKSCLRRDPEKPRAIKVLGKLKKPGFTLVPVLGRIAAGTPILAVENEEDILVLSSELIGHGDFFALRVRGNSMIEAGIFDGDLVVVRRQPTAENGDIVAVLLEDEATVKRFYKENSHIRLQPENKTMEPILVKEANILGKVVSLVRSY